MYECTAEEKTQAKFSDYFYMSSNVKVMKTLVIDKSFGPRHKSSFSAPCWSRFW